MIALKVFLTTLFLYDYSFGFTCKNEKNENVDWYYLYKLPIEHNHYNHLIDNGTAYMFMTSEDYKTGWKLSNISIDSPNSIPGFTLQPFYSKSSSMHIFYNDEHPQGRIRDKLGHTKGVLMYNDSTGFWLIHSVPKYPPTDKYNYPASGTRFGQSFLCISLNLENVNNVGMQLQYNEPYIYEAYISNDLNKILGNVKDAINHKKVNAPWYRLTILKSLNGQSFTSFAKSSKFGKELYEDWIAPTFKSDLLAETWLNGAGKLPSDCNNIFQVHNVKSIMLNSNITFSSSKDHSKWTVTSSNNTNNWICVGDINREEHQKHRGGGTVCLSNNKIWNIYKTSIDTIEACN